MRYSAQNYLKRCFWYSTTLLAVLLCVLLLLPTGEETALGGNQKYIMQLVSIFTLVLIPIAIVHFNRRLEKADRSNIDSFDKLYKAKGVLRSCATALCIIVNAVAYFLVDYKSAIYCIAIGIAAHIYCYPSCKEYDALLSGESTK